MALPNERKPAVIDLKNLDSYVGNMNWGRRLLTRFRVKVTSYSVSEAGEPKKNYYRFALSFIAKGVGAAKKSFKETGRERVVTMLDRREKQ